MGEIEIKKHENKDKINLIKSQVESAFFKILPVILLGIFMAISEFIYYICAINIDIYKYPSICMILFVVLSVLLKWKPKQTVDKIGVEEYRKNIYKIQKHSFKGVIYQLMYLSYFSYMFWILVFLK